MDRVQRGGTVVRRRRQVERPVDRAVGRQPAATQADRRQVRRERRGLEPGLDAHRLHGEARRRRREPGVRAPARQRWRRTARHEPGGRCICAGVAPGWAQAARDHAGLRRAPNDADNRQDPEERKARKYSARTYDTLPDSPLGRWLDDRRRRWSCSRSTGCRAARPAGGTAIARSRGSGGRLGNSGESSMPTGHRTAQRVVFAATTNRDQAARANRRPCVVAGGPRWRAAAADGPRARLLGSPGFAPDGRTVARQGRAGAEAGSTTRRVSCSGPGRARRAGGRERRIRRFSGRLSLRCR